MSKHFIISNRHNFRILARVAVVHQVVQCLIHCLPKIFHQGRMLFFCCPFSSVHFKRLIYSIAKKSFNGLNAAWVLGGHSTVSTWVITLPNWIKWTLRANEWTLLNGTFRAFRDLLKSFITGRGGQWGGGANLDFGHPPFRHPCIGCHKFQCSKGSNVWMLGDTGCGSMALPN